MSAVALSGVSDHSHPGPQCPLLKSATSSWLGRVIPQTFHEEGPGATVPQIPLGRNRGGFIPGLPGGPSAGRDLPEGLSAGCCEGPGPGGNTGSAAATHPLPRLDIACTTLARALKQGTSALRMVSLVHPLVHVTPSPFLSKLLYPVILIFLKKPFV